MDKLILSSDKGRICFMSTFACPVRPKFQRSGVQGRSSRETTGIFIESTGTQFCRRGRQFSLNESVRLPRVVDSKEKIPKGVRGRVMKVLGNRS